jgi:hypothetical protein
VAKRRSWRWNSAHVRNALADGEDLVVADLHRAVHDDVQVLYRKCGSICACKRVHRALPPPLARIWSPPRRRALAERLNASLRFFSSSRCGGGAGVRCPARFHPCLLQRAQRAHQAADA